MSLIHGLDCAIGLAKHHGCQSREGVGALTRGAQAHFAWGPLLVSAGAPEGVSFVLRRIPAEISAEFLSEFIY